MKIKYIAVILLSFLSTFTLHSKPILIKEFVQGYLTKNLVIQSKKQDMKKARAQILSSRAVDDIHLELNADYQLQKDMGSEGLVPIKKNIVKKAEMKLMKIISQTGTRLEVSHILSHSKTKLGTSSISTLTIPELEAVNNTQSKAYQNEINFGLIQPILRNCFGLLDRYPKKIARLEKTIQKIEYLELVENKKLEAVKLYLDWIYFRRQKQILKKIIQNNRMILNQVRKKVRIGLGIQSDLEMARSNVLLYEKSFLEIKKSEIELLNELKKYLNINSDFYPDEDFLNIQLPKVKTKPNQNLRIFNAIELAVKQLSFMKKIASNKMLPQFDIIANYKLYSSKKKFFDSYKKLKTNEFFVGFQFKMPLQNKEARAEKMKAKAEYRKILIRRKKIHRDFYHAKIHFKNNLKLINELKAKQKRYVASLYKAYRSDLREYRKGIVNLKDLVTTLNEYSNSKLVITQYQIEYLKNYYGYLELIDQLAF